jgi:glutamyl-tRNA synthetase
MIEAFDISAVNKAASSFNRGKLDWLNQHYIQHGDPKHIAHLLSPHMGRIGIDPTEGPDLADVVTAQASRAKTLTELAEISAFCYRDFDDYDPAAAKKHLRPVAREPLERVREALELLALDDWKAEQLHYLIERVAGELELNLGKVAQPLRVAVVGRAASPGIDVTLALVGKEATLRRIDRALAFVDQRAARDG